RRSAGTHLPFPLRRGLNGGAPPGCASHLTTVFKNLGWWRARYAFAHPQCTATSPPRCLSVAGLKSAPQLFSLGLQLLREWRCRSVFATLDESRHHAVGGVGVDECGSVVPRTSDRQPVHDLRLGQVVGPQKLATRHVLSDGLSAGARLSQSGGGPRT